MRFLHKDDQPPPSSTTHDGKAHLVKSVHSSDYKEFLLRLVRARRAAGLTQAEVATRLGVPQSRVSRAETGERRVDIIELKRFAELYGKRITYFVP